MRIVTLCDADRAHLDPQVEPSTRCLPKPKLLASAYRRSLQVAAQHGLRSISIPSISTGAFVYPIRLDAPIALKTIIQFLETEQHSLDEVRMVLYTREDDAAYSIFAHALEQILSERARNGSV